MVRNLESWLSHFKTSMMTMTKIQLSSNAQVKLCLIKKNLFSSNLFFPYANNRYISVICVFFLILYISFRNITLGCSFRRRIRENIAVHIQQHHDGDLSLTIQKVTTKPREPRPVLKCDECPTTVSTMTQLLQHRDQYF